MADTLRRKLAIASWRSPTEPNIYGKLTLVNGTIRFGRYVPHDEVAVAFLVSMEDGSDLAKAKVSDIDRRSVAEIARELREQVERLRGGSDPDWERSKGLIRLLPSWLLRPIVRFTGWLTSSLGVDAPALGLGRFPFGSAIITNGFQGGVLARTVRRVFDDPWSLDRPVDGSAATPAPSHVTPGGEPA